MAGPDDRNSLDVSGHAAFLHIAALLPVFTSPSSLEDVSLFHPFDWSMSTLSLTYGRSVTPHATLRSYDDVDVSSALDSR